ncbi:MAG TPA: hypothetical protein VMT50_02030 [Steroidobacteraceae bacterium]|nr:hypothetical protein [Steroidobacteraceae bacterium]
MGVPIIPLWFKLAYTVFVLYIMVVWLRHYGWTNFLWFSDIAFIGAVPAMWLESGRLASALTVLVLLPELLWNLDFLGRLLLHRPLTGLTDYMFERDRPRLLRGLSLFHVPLPLVLLWLLAVYGYDARAGLAGAIACAAVVLPLSRWLGDAEKNINWTYGLGRHRSPLPGPLHVAVLYAVFVLLVFVPTHLLLRAAGL